MRFRFLDATALRPFVGATRGDLVRAGNSPVMRVSHTAATAAAAAAVAAWTATSRISRLRLRRIITDGGASLQQRHPHWLAVLNVRL